MSLYRGVTRLLPSEVLDAAVERADQAMYRAKTQGRRRSLVAPAPGAAASTSALQAVSGA